MMKYRSRVARAALSTAMDLRPLYRAPRRTTPLRRSFSPSHSFSESLRVPQHDDLDPPSSPCCPSRLPATRSRGLELHLTMGPIGLYLTIRPISHDRTSITIHPVALAPMLLWTARDPPCGAAMSGVGWPWCCYLARVEYILQE